VFGNLDEGVLERTSLHNARALIVNSTDDRNAATILAARQLGYKGEILALVEDPYHRQPMILAGASGAYTPRHILGAALAARASQKVSPTVAGIQQLGHKLQVTEARVMRDSVLAGKTLTEAGIGQHDGVTVIGLWASGKLVAPLPPRFRLQSGNILILIGAPECLQTFMDVCAGAKQLRRHGLFLVRGAGEVGRKVVELLNDAGEKRFWSMIILGQASTWSATCSIPKSCRMSGRRHASGHRRVKCRHDDAFLHGNPQGPGAGRTGDCAGKPRR
jgi:Trk K+ transport system NAD-binding subunit